MLWIFRVSGRSLYPTYQDGDFVLISRVPVLFRQLTRGDVVVLKHPNHGTLIKQVDRVIPKRDEVFVTGTQVDSLDSRDFGPIQWRGILGKVIWHIRKPKIR